MAGIIGSSEAESRTAVCSDWPASGRVVEVDVGPGLAESPTGSTEKIPHGGDDQVWRQFAECRQIKVYVKPFGAELCHKVLKSVRDAGGDDRCKKCPNNQQAVMYSIFREGAVTRGKEGGRLSWRR